MDTVYYSFTDPSMCLLLETELLDGEGTVEILTDKPVPKTVLTNFKRIDRNGCGKVPRYTFEVNGVLRKEREEHTVNIALK